MMRIVVLFSPWIRPVMIQSITVFCITKLTCCLFCTGWGTTGMVFCLNIMTIRSLTCSLMLRIIELSPTGPI